VLAALDDLEGESPLRQPLMQLGARLHKAEAVELARRAHEPTLVVEEGAESELVERAAAALLQETGEKPAVRRVPRAELAAAAAAEVAAAAPVEEDEGPQEMTGLFDDDDE
jgi:hypothetical protein